MEATGGQERFSKPLRHESCDVPIRCVCAGGCVRVKADALWGSLWFESVTTLPVGCSQPGADSPFSPQLGNQPLEAQAITT